MKTSIRKRILSLVLTTSIAVGLIISIIATLTIYLIIVNNNDDDTALMAKAYSLNVKTSMGVIQTQIKNVAKVSSIVDEKMSLDERKNILAKETEGTLFSEFHLVTKEGMTDADIDVTDREYFKQAMKGNTYISSPVVRKTNGKLAIMVSTPLTAEGASGILYGVMDYSYFSDIIENIKIGDNGYGFVIDSAGTAIAHPDQKIVEDMTNFIEMAKEDSSYSEMAAMIEKMKNGDTGNLIYHFGGARKYVSYIPIEGVEGWSLAVCVGYDEVIRQFWITVIACFGALLLMVIVSILTTSGISKSIAAPIKTATQRLEALAHGDINSPVEVAKSKDETLILTTALSDTVYSLKTYIGDIENVLSNVADGNLTITSDQNYIGDFMPIKTSLTKILESLRETFSDVNAASMYVKTSAEQVSAGATVLSESASTEASTIQELSAMVSDISNNVKNNAENAKNASELTKATSEQVDSGNTSMNQMLSAMSDISQSSNQISNIIKVIDDIAFQTNILALNAAVEAARAGSAGKGFAVVADEVRNLAAKSAVAAKDTSALIETSISTVQKGTDLAGETADALNRIVSMMDEVEEIMDKIAVASNEQATAISQINVGMDQITGVIQTNSATAEESAAASEELTGQAQLMKEKVDKFRL